MQRLLILFMVLLTIPLGAQKPLENDEVIVTVGANVPMYNGIESDVVIGLHYGHYYINGVGFRTGFQYIPSVADIDNSFSVPLAVTYRTGSRSRSQKLTSAAYAVVRTQARDEDRALKYGLVNLLMNLFDRIEFHAVLILLDCRCRTGHQFPYLEIRSQAYACVPLQHHKQLHIPSPGRRKRFR